MDGEPVISNKTAEIVKAVLSIDYPSIIKQFKATDTVLNATVDADAIVALISQYTFASHFTPFIAVTLR